MPQQENGARPACPLPYELAVHGGLTEDRLSFGIHFSAGRGLFGERAAGAPFHVYAPGRHRGLDSTEMTSGRAWSFATAAGQKVHYAWPLAAFAEAAYHLRIHGPNGFYREFKGNRGDPAIDIVVEPAREGDQPTGDLTLILTGRGAQGPLSVTVEDVSYGADSQSLTIKGAPDSTVRKVIPLQKSYGWYDLRITLTGSPAFSQRFAGRIETGRESRTDPLMG
jgi:phospholipase C